MAVKRVLFLCSRNRLRSPTAEQVFGGRVDLEVASAELAPDADEPVTPELLEWAEIIFVMEKRHRAALSRRFRRHTGHARILCLDIADDFDFMNPRLVKLLNARAGPHLR